MKPSHISDKEFVKIAREFMSDTTPLPVVINIKEAWILISGLQLATRHPAIGKAMRDELTIIGIQFQQAIMQRHPDAETALNMGWNSKFDKK